MFFNTAPTIIKLSRKPEVVSVKDKEKEFKIDIGGTWLYEIGLPDLYEASPIKVYSRVRYLDKFTTKESFESFVDKMPFFKTEDNTLALDFNMLLDSLDTVCIKIHTGIIGEKQYILQINVKDIEVGSAQIYVVFSTFSTNTNITKLIKKLEKLVKKKIK